ncbi:MAG: DUF58 domain-containing protein [Gammaproteobacteria bacterium]|nr:DUF58 domain-containing protein [Gammaproteobacteria bacterium]
MKILRRLLIFNFHLVHRFGKWLERRFTVSGRVLLGTVVAAGTLGIDTRQSLAYQGFALGVGLLLVAFLCIPFFRARFTAKRIIPHYATVGQSFSYRISVKNGSGRPQRDLCLVDELVAPPPTVEDFFRARQPDEENLNWFDRSVGYPRWAWMYRQSIGAETKQLNLPNLPLSSESTVEMEMVPLRRGYLRFAQIRIARPDPFGLLNSLVRLEQPDSLLILPKRYPVSNFQLTGKRHYQQGGVTLASHVGDSEEFISVRDYRPGDPPRHIHWKSWARVGKPIVKEFQAEFFVRHALILDTFTSTSGPLFEEAVSVAASFCSIADGQESLLDLMFIGDEAYCFTSGRGLGTSSRLLEILACVQPCAELPFSRLTQSVAGHASNLSGCICILLDWDGERQLMIEQLRALQVPVLVLVLTNLQDEAALEPGPMLDVPHLFHILHTNKIQEGLEKL